MTKSEYYKGKSDRHTERANYHDEMADEGIHPEYHIEQAARHRDEAAKLTSKVKNVKKKKKVKKDIGGFGTGGLGYPVG